MADKNLIQQVVERAVSQVLESHIPYMRDDLVRRVIAEVEPTLHAAAPVPSGTPDALLQATSSVHHATAQREVLAALLDGASHFAGRTALFVVRGNSALGWQGRGFAANDAVKNFAVDLNAGLAARAMQDRHPIIGLAADLDPRFVASFGPPADGRVILLPLLMKDKVAALVQADGGSSGKLDTAALELLVYSTGLWLELLSFRKGTGAPAEHGEQAAAPDVPAPRAQAEPVAAPMPKPVEMAFAAAASAGPSMAVSVPKPAAVSSSAAPADEEELHRKARRFAKLLVDEIKLYNKGKVEEGKRSRDLYDRLREDIDKSRAAYDKRYGSTAVAGANYFVQELVRILADNDSSLLGPNFSG
jgi:hypothetical protein